MVSKNDTVRQVRLPSSLANDAEAVFEKLNITFSEAVRLFLAETAAKGKLPFRPEEKTGGDLLAMRKTEEAYIDRILGTGKSAEERLKDAIFGPRSGKDMHDEDLRSWGRDIGLGETLSVSALEELYDTGIFPHSVVTGDIDGDFYSDDGDTRFSYLESIRFVENIRANIDKTAEKMKANAISAYLADEYNYQKGEH